MLSSVHMQQTEKLLKLSKEKKDGKKFKSFVKEEDLKDFEEDVLGETRLILLTQ